MIELPPMSVPFQIGTTPTQLYPRGIDGVEVSKADDVPLRQGGRAEPVVEALFAIPGITRSSP